jgi:hypothetical protein
MLASKLLEICKSLLVGDNRNGQPLEDRAEEAVPWARKAFTLIEQLDELAVAGLAELKVCSRVLSGSDRFSTLTITQAVYSTKPWLASYQRPLLSFFNTFIH